MALCNHKKLVLLPEKKNLLLCRHCHLKIKAEELGGGYCPECFEADGKKRYDFQEAAVKETGTDRYRCEECGAIIESN